MSSYEIQLHLLTLLERMQVHQIYLVHQNLKKDSLILHLFERLFVPQVSLTLYQLDRVLINRHKLVLIK